MAVMGRKGVTKVTHALGRHREGDDREGVAAPRNRAIVQPLTVAALVLVVFALAGAGYPPSAGWV